jgi:uncharacterized membrane protein YcaP (DUF421 family)
MLSRKSLTFRKLFNGKPIILLDPNGINYENLKKVNMNFNDLMEGIHTAGYFNLEELLYVILQTNGSMTVVNRSAFSPVTANDLQIKKENASLPIILITKGKIMKENMRLAKIDEKFIKANLDKAGIKNIKDVIILTLDNNGKIYVQEKNNPFKSFDSNYNKGGQW